MKHLFKIAGFCLASMLVMGLAIVGTASAAKPVWELCSEGGSATKYSEHQCTKAEGAGKWQWNEITGTEKVVSHGTLRLDDTKTALGDTGVQCSGKDEGIVGPGKLDKVTSITAEKCNVVVEGGCKKLVGVAVARNLPWQTELFETEKKQFDKISEDGKGQPGWDVTCETLLGTKSDICESVKGKEETTEMINEATGGSLLVRSVFSGKQKATCTEGGTGSGEVKGSIALLAGSGWGLRVS